MKEHFQDYGVRKWAGDDLIELQSEPLAALQTLVAPYAPCIVSGCEVTPVEPRGYSIAPGLVALPGKDAKGKACVKLARFAGVKSGNDEEPYYLTLTYQTATRTYMDGKSKAIAYDYTATPTRNRPEKEGTFLEIGAEGGHRLVDRLGITQKLDQEGGDASKTIVEFAESTDAQPELTSHSTLGKLIGQIKKLINNKVDNIEGKGLSEKDFTAALKEKLEGIEDGANKYIHPVFNIVKSTGLYKIGVLGGHVGAATAVSKDDITALGIPGQDTVYIHPTSAGYKHIPSGGSSGQYLKYDSSGTATWASITTSTIGAATSNHSHPNASTTSAGFLSAADKAKLDGILAGANVKVVAAGYRANAHSPYIPKLDIGTWSSTNTATGVYTVSVTTALDLRTCMICLTGTGGKIASLSSIEANQFSVKLYDGASLANGNFYFTILAFA